MSCLHLLHLLHLLRMRNAAVLAGAVLLLSSCRDPRAEANIAQAMMDMGTSVAAMEQDFGALQWQVDSLRQVVARQDTIIIRLASHVGLPLASR